MTYNGHKNWTHWNVSLWLNNDEHLYREMRGLCRTLSRQKAAETMLDRLVNGYGAPATPDGAKYSVSAIKSAMVGL